MTIKSTFIESVVEDLKNLLIKYSDMSNDKVEESLHLLFGKVKTNVEYNIETLVEFVFFAASLYELKARALMKSNNELEWTDEISLLKDRDLAFNRLLQFKAFAEVGLAFATKIQKEEKSVPVFKSYILNVQEQQKIFMKNIDYKEFEMVAEEVYTRYNTDLGFTHIDTDIPDIQESINSFIKKVNKDAHTTFEEIISGGSYEEAITYFLALLETVRWGIVSATQENNESGIRINKNE